MKQMAIWLVFAIVIGIVLIGVFFVRNYWNREEALTAADKAVVQDCRILISLAQKWYRKPEVIGGATKGFSGIKFSLLGKSEDEISNNGLTWKNENGTYTLSTAAQQSFSLVGQGHSGFTVRFLAITSTSIPEPMISIPSR